MFEQTPGIRLAAAIEPLGPVVREAFATLRAAGVRGVQWPAAAAGLRPRDLDRGARRDLRAVLRRFELELAGLDLPIPPEHFADPARVDRAVAATEEAVRFASEFARVPVCMRLPVPGASGAGGADEAASDGAEAAIAAVLAAADRHGVRLADETVPLAVGTPHGEVVGLGLDPVALLAAGVDPAGAALEHASAIVSARLSDLDAAGVRVPPGRGGRLDVVRYRVALEIGGVGGFVVVDPRQWSDPRGGIVASVEAWREAGSPVEPS